MRGRKWIAFIDLLGTKESSKISDAKFFSSLGNFHDTLGSYASILDNDDRVYLFSDSAVIEIEDTNKFILYYSLVRRSLFALSLYFKCAVSRGSLQAEKWDAAKVFKKNSAKSSDLSKIVNGFTFGKDLVHIYLNHEKFKGIGSFVEDIPENKAFEDKFVSSAFLSKSQNYRYELFYDIPFNFSSSLQSLDPENPAADIFSDSDKEDGLLNIYLHNMVKAKSISIQYGAYYVPSLITMLKSSDFRSIHIDNNGKFAGYPGIFYYIYLNSKMSQHVLEIPGGELIYFCFLEKIFTESSILSKSDKSGFIGKLEKNRRILSKIHQVPTKIMSASVRESVINYIADHATKWPKSPSLAD